MSDTTTIAVLVRLHVQDGTEAPFLSELSAVLEKVRDEPACISIQAYQDGADPCDFVLVEIWRSRAEFEEFDGNREYLAEYMSRAKLMWSRPRDLSIWNQVA
ncbi:hypothetical protein DSM104299_00405 [Baekduia alba]|uniref:putative quinol monooxygenase n=1 Tax=Baekduia alba TaxID=2997333 RepID=UPI002341B1E9|nr:antibiotic biosynthesis monooxygenase [Baekduia alba]WCB91729.1 hypothetical protein DSM104299_00405 [Baekduia alba]